MQMVSHGAAKVSARESAKKRVVSVAQNSSINLAANGLGALVSHPN
jgi:hypothetical protein